VHADGFPPVEDAHARVLVLGSLPGQVSLRERQYYAQPRNAFWRIMGKLFGAGPGLPYGERLRILMRRHVALWDVCASAHRTGALDAAIVRASVVTNGFAEFLAEHPELRLVCFNGQVAAELYRRHVLPGLPVEFQALQSVTLPSTSPAHAAMTFEQKLERWNIVREAVMKRAASNSLSPKKLLHTKWTAVEPRNKEKHFLVTNVIDPEPPGSPVVSVEIEAVHSKRTRIIGWRELTDDSRR